MTTCTAVAGELPLVERIDSPRSSVDVFRRLAGLPHVLFLDSAMRHPQLGRYSFIAADPIEWLVVPADGSDALAQLAPWYDGGLRYSERAPDGGLIGTTSKRISHLPPFQGGWAGMLGYELSRGLERVPAAAVDEFQLPALAMGLYDVVVAIDHFQRDAWLISQGWPETDPYARRERAEARLARFREILSSGEPGEHHERIRHRTGTRPLLESELAPQFAVTGHSGLMSNFSAEDYCKAIQRAIDYIHAGDVFQVNLSQRLLQSQSSSPIDLYCRLRERNPAPFAGYLDGGDWQIACASPERFIRVDKGHVETRPIKGTRGRARRPEADLFAGDELRSSDKDRAENIMIVDLLRNDLSRTCRPDSVRVSQLCGLENYEFVQHLVSVVEGELRDDCSAIDVLRTAFPGGSVTGAPKVRAMEIIAELEPTARGAYCGSLGYIGLDGRMDTNIMIRTITASRGWCQLPVGGGIVAPSKPREEYQETWHKAAGMLRALVP